jgi:hypothetical protein
MSFGHFIKEIGIYIKITISAEFVNPVILITLK